MTSLKLCSHLLSPAPKQIRSGSVSTARLPFSADCVCLHLGLGELVWFYRVSLSSRALDPPLGQRPMVLSANFNGILSYCSFACFSALAPLYSINVVGKAAGPVSMWYDPFLLLEHQGYSPACQTCWPCHPTKYGLPRSACWYSKSLVTMLTRRVHVALSLIVQTQF